jgi:hypothetical protein
MSRKVTNHGRAIAVHAKGDELWDSSIFNFDLKIIE